MDGRTWRVGELAAATGLTVRTLHHWDECGLVKPSLRSPAGHRLYTADDVRRLHRVHALRSLGLSLTEVGAALDGGLPLAELLRRQLRRTEEAADATDRLRARLRGLLRRLDGGGQPAVEELLETMEVTVAVESYYTPEQQETLRRRAEELGPEGMAAAERAWAEVIAGMERARTAGTDPADPAVQELAARWRALVAQFTGGDEGIAANLERMYDERGPAAASRGALSPELMAYAQRAMAAAG